MAHCYTLQELQEGNPVYHMHHWVTEADARRVNDLVARIGALRDEANPQPLEGDCVFCQHPEQKAEYARLYSLDDRRLLVVMFNPMGTWVGSENLGVSGGGGPEMRIAPELFLQHAVLQAKMLARFQTWGHMGPWGDGAIEFQAEVFSWRLDAQAIVGWR